MKVAEIVREAIEPMFNKDIKLVDVEYVKKVDGMHLIVYIDKLNGVNIDDCVAVNDMIEPVLDEINPTGDASYVLDVSSWGLDKPLKYDWQFKKYQGEKVDVKLYRKVNGRKDFTATYISQDDKKYQFKSDDEAFEINKEDVAYILPHVEF